MRWFERFRMAILMLFQRKNETALLNDELQFYLDQQAAENIANGMSPEEARSVALRSFGNPTLLRDQARSTWSWNWLETGVHDIKYGARTLVRSPGFALIAILVMALGIGATTSMFTIVRAVLLKPLPFRDPAKLVMVYEHFRASTGDGFNVVAPADFRDWREQTHGFQDMAAWRDYGFNLTGEHQELPETVQAAGGSWNLLSVLGIKRLYAGRRSARGQSRCPALLKLVSKTLRGRRLDTWRIDPSGHNSVYGRRCTSALVCLSRRADSAVGPVCADVHARELSSA
jgi:hypothetical protein